MTWARAAAILAGIGATVGVALDGMHVLSGTTRYTAPSWLGLAWWVFPLFASAAVALGLGPRVIERALGVRRADAVPSGRAVAIAMGLFVAAYLASCVLHGIVGTIVLALMAVVAWWVADRRGVGIAHAAVAAVAGTCVEIALVRAGLFVHAGTEIAGVALWLPCLYLCASVGVGALGRRLV